MSKIAATNFIAVILLVLFTLAGIGYYASLENTSEDPARKPAKIGKELSVNPSRTAQDNSLAPVADKGGETTKKPNRNTRSQQDLQFADIAAKIQTILEQRRHPSSEGVAILATLLEDSNATVQNEALDALGHIGLTTNLTNTVFSILKEKAIDPNFSSRGQALITAAMLERDEQILPVVENYISGNEEEQLEYAIRAMSFIKKPTCIPLLQRVLESNVANKLQRNAFIILARINDPAAKDLIRNSLFSYDADKQLNSAWALSRMNNDEYLPLLTEAIERDELYKDAIGSIVTSPAGPKVFGELFQREDIERDRKVAWQKIIADNIAFTPKYLQEEISQVTERHVPPLASKSNDDAITSTADAEERAQEAAEGEGAVEGAKKYTYRDLAEVFNDPDPHERRSAWMVYKRYADLSRQSDLESVRRAAENSDPFIREDAQRILAQRAH